MNDPKALSGIRVLDFTRFISGPYCGQLLGDLGAEVIKIEKGSGDTTRPFLPVKDDVSLYYTALNRNKKSMAIDIRNPEGIALIKRMLPKVDVIVENFRPGTMDKMGLGREQIDAINPGIIVAHISGYGQDGPYRNRAAFDCVLEAMSGMMSMTGMEGAPPLLMGQAYVDFIAGTFGALGVVAALLARKENGGQDLDISMLEAAMAYSLYAPAHFLANGEITGQGGNRDRVLAPANAFKAKDGKYVYIHAGTNQFFEVLCRHIGREELLAPERFKHAAVRMANADEVEAVVQEWVSTQISYDIEERMAQLGIPCAVVADMSDLVKNPQVLARDMLRTFKYPGGREIPEVASNLRLSKTPGRTYLRPPFLGEHTDEVLRELLNLSDDEIKKLRDAAVLE